MRQRKSWFGINAIVAVFGVALIVPMSGWAASTYKILHRFTAGADGGYPAADLIVDAAGNLYGTAGAAVFQLKSNADGSWTYSTLHNFTGADGDSPVGSLVFDGAGNLYGATWYGGATFNGTVFKLRPNADGSWTESVLYSFCSVAKCTDGQNPVGGLVFDAAGNLYGTTSYGGRISTTCSNGCGVVFKLKPKADGTWAENVLYRFCKLTNCPDGDFPTAGLSLDKAGNLYGTTAQGGAFGNGTVFKLNSNTAWTESVLHSFCPPHNCGDGARPLTRLILDASGNLYGTASLGGTWPGYGVAFKLKPKSDGSWGESVLHSFNKQDGAYPWADLIFDPAGNLYGTTRNGGSAGDGVVFKLSPGSGGSWVYSAIHNFLGNPELTPLGGVVLDQAGNLYGTTNICASGTGCYGVVFEITP